jgi:hypothetical protein
MLRILTLSVLLAATGLRAQIQHFSGHLDGGQEVPPVATAAVGWVLVRVDTATNQVRVFAHGNGLAAVAAHLHRAPVGANGPVILPLAGGPTIWTGAGTLAPAEVAAIQAGDTYVNLHTPANPGGEIRAQVLPAKASRFTAVLDGAQPAPPTGSAATGEMTAFLHEPDRVLVYEMNVSGLVGTVAHIHRGLPGVSGGIVFPLDGAGTRWCGVTGRFSDGALATLRAGGLYVNVHTAAFPGGEIRGQLLADPADHRALLSGAEEVPPVATPARGVACLRLNPDRSLTYRVTARGMTGTVAHIHLAPAGSNGPVVFPLVGGPNVFAGTTPPLTPAQVADLGAGRYYVNVHSAAHPGGEIRGQVGAGELPSTFGGGCPVAGGGWPEIGATGLACMGSSLDITLYGAAASRPGVVLFGASRDLGPLGPLPVSLAALGAPDCFLLHDNIGLSLPAATDALGCAKANLPIPFVPGANVTFYAQWFVLDPTANPFGLASSNGLSFAIR